LPILSDCLPSRVSLDPVKHARVSLRQNYQRPVVAKRTSLASAIAQDLLRIYLPASAPPTGERGRQIPCRCTPWHAVRLTRGTMMVHILPLQNRPVISLFP